MSNLYDSVVSLPSPWLLNATLRKQSLISLGKKNSLGIYPYPEHADIEVQELNLESSFSKRRILELRGKTKLTLAFSVSQQRKQKPGQVNWAVQGHMGKHAAFFTTG